MVSRLLRALMFGTLATGVLVPTAAAAAPDVFKEAFEGGRSFPAGDLCDFDYDQTYVGVDLVRVFEDRVLVQEKVTVTHTNADTGFALTEVLTTNYFFYEDHEKDAGQIWQLRDASGKIARVESGRATFSDDGDTFTPGITPSFREVICTELGGNPIPVE